MYYPADRRFKLLAKHDVSPTRLPGLPLVEDPEWPKRNRNEGTRPMRDRYNEHTPLTLVMEGVWLMSSWHAAWNPQRLRENGIGATFNVAHGAQSHPADGIAIIPEVDMNAVTTQRDALDLFCNGLLMMNEYHGHTGVGMYCRNGANRSNLGMICFLMSKCGISAEEARDHLVTVRKLTDVQRGYHGGEKPMVWAKRHEARFHSLFVLPPLTSRTFKYDMLPPVVTDREFITVIKRHRRDHADNMNYALSLHSSDDEASGHDKRRKKNEAEDSDEKRREDKGEDSDEKRRLDKALGLYMGEEKGKEKRADSRGSTPRGSVFAVSIKPEETGSHSASASSSAGPLAMPVELERDPLGTAGFVWLATGSNPSQEPPATMEGMVSKFDEMQRDHHLLLSKHEAQREEQLAQQHLAAEAQQRNQRGQDLLSALLMNNVGQVDRLIEADPLELDFAALDQSGMTCLHHACWLTNRRWAEVILGKKPALCDALTYYVRTPSSWSALNCLADRPKVKDGQEEHMLLATSLVRAMSQHRLTARTGKGTTVVHQLTARGHNRTLECILPIMENKLGKERLAALLNTAVGRHQLGTVDVALKSNMDVVTLLKGFGGRELCPPPDDWVPARRREQGDGVCNWRSDTENRWWKDRRDGWEDRSWW